MLKRLAADTSTVIHRILVWAAFVCCAFVVLSFVMFVHDQAAAGSQHQSNELVGATTSPGGSAPAPVHHSQPRRFIDGAANDLTSPFRSLVHSTNVWVTHGVPTLLALLVYGFGLGFLARFSRGYS
jgi:hypothetical protein